MMAPSSKPKQASMSALAQRLKDRALLTGLALFLVSIALYLIGELPAQNDGRQFGFFLFHYLIAVGYFLFIWIGGRLKRPKEGRYYFLVNLVLFFISAYALNRNIPVFAISTGWFSALLAVVSLHCLSLIVFGQMPPWLRHCSMFLSGGSLLVFLYLAIYIAPIYPFSLIGLVAIGISFHSFVPLLLLVFLLRHLRLVTDKRLVGSLAAGILSVLIVVLAYSMQWASLNKSVSRIQQEQLIASNNDLPAWVMVAQKLPHGWLTEKYLKVDMVYGMPAFWEENDFWSLPGRSFDEVKKHDPLVVLARLLAPPAQLDRTERINILETTFDARHQAQERLWSGENLRTENVITNALVYPDLRLAYTEKTITVRNTEETNSWQRQEEAIYTFHLPPGSVVTSLSLWIDGKEEKGILTSVKKADSAYKQIVGVESRDPSVVHWQEGNTVSVRVFPVLSGSHRFFKIGITSPLRLHENTLTYENIWFEGPDASSAQELVQLAFDKPVRMLDAPDGLKQSGTGFRGEQKYQPDWQLSMEDPGLRNGVFSFGGNSYAISQAASQTHSVSVRNVYLDVDASWTEKEFTDLLHAAKGKHVYIFTDAMREVKADNRKALFREAASRQFSLFPFYLVNDHHSSIIITNGNGNGPNVHDLKNSRFAARMEKALQPHKRYYVCNIGVNLSPLIKTLKEHRFLHYAEGSTEDAVTLIAKGMFPTLLEDAETIAVDDAQIAIRRTATTASSSAPDHLMRVFAYNHVLQQMKGAIFSPATQSDSLIAEAEQAYVVTPLSSLVVLEKQADYDRFDIRKSKDALDNASLNNIGAVPEPGTWLLLVVTAVMLMSILFRDKLRKVIRL
jgi:XrtN system VIT domain protein